MDRQDARYRDYTTKKAPICIGAFNLGLSAYFFAGAAAGAVAGLGVTPIFFKTMSEIFASAG